MLNVGMSDTTAQVNHNIFSRNDYCEEVNECAKVLALEARDHLILDAYSNQSQAVEKSADDILYPHRWFVYSASSTTTHGAVLVHGDAQISNKIINDVTDTSNSLSKVICDIAWQQFRADCIEIASSKLEEMNTEEWENHV